MGMCVCAAVYVPLLTIDTDAYWLVSLGPSSLKAAEITSTCRLLIETPSPTSQFPKCSGPNWLQKHKTSQRTQRQMTSPEGADVSPKKLNAVQDTDGELLTNGERGVLIYSALLYSIICLLCVVSAAATQ
mmetsp:Transcript_1146/g.1976  ORF Transcript_1146/g.1976 Transcript_1146/m.1976 type:complete len:130 (-) Transcript_1146:54-443(-)